MDSEYETVRLGGEAERETAPSPWQGGAVPLRGAAEPDGDRERRLEIVSRGARRRRTIRRGLVAVALLVPVALGVLLLPSGERVAKAPGELRALAREAPARPARSRPAAPDARQRRGGHHPRGRDADQKRAAADGASVPAAAPEGAAETPAMATTVEAEPAPTEPAPPPPPAEPIGGEAAEAEFGFEN